MPEWKRVSEHLEVREGKKKTSYRVNFRQGRFSVRQVLKGEHRSLRDVKRAAEKLIYETKFGKRSSSKTLVRCSDLVEQLLFESKSQDAATQAIKKNIFELHLLPWLEDNYTYASELNVETWPKYKAYKRSENPTIALENHVKYFRMLRKRAFERGVISGLFPVKFDLKKEEFRAIGQVIPPEDEADILAECNRVWKNRSVIQRDTGMRPGEVRCLRKDRVQFLSNAVKIRLFEEDTKTNRYREFISRSPRVIAALEQQFGVYLDSPYFFAMETDHKRPMDKHMSGWRSAIARANKKRALEGRLPMPTDYTPHDWRHTYATEMFKKLGLQGAAALCYQLDMSWETAQRVYFHLSAEDTIQIADLAAIGRAG